MTDRSIGDFARLAQADPAGVVSARVRPEGWMSARAASALRLAIESAPAFVVVTRRAQILARGRSLETTAAMLREARS